MRRALNSLLYYVCYGATFVLSLLPFRVLYAVADALYYLVYHIVRYRRKLVRRNISTAFPDKTATEILSIERGFYHWLCDYFVETIKLASISEKEMRRRMVFHNTDVIDRLTAEGTSVALLLGHFCNWEWVSTLPISIERNRCFCGELYHQLRNKVADRLFLKLRQRFFTTCVNKNEALRTLVRENQQRPSVVGFIADQKPKWNNIHLWVNFLNHRDTPVFTGTERIIKMLNQAFVYSDLSRPRRGYYECNFILIEQHTHDMPDYTLTEQYMQLLEDSIRRQPQYYLWSHDRWSRSREEFERLYYIKDGRVVPKAQTSRAE